MNAFIKTLLQTKSLLLLTFFPIMLGSCVAKKKFVVMEESKLKAEERIIDLNRQVSSLQGDFERAKEEFHTNDSKKKTLIDSLELKIRELSGDLENQSEDIEGQSFSFQVEKRRLNQMLAEKDREIRDITRQITLLKLEIDDAKTANVDAGISVSNLQNEKRSLENRLKERDQEIESIKQILTKKEDEIFRLNAFIDEQNKKIEVLQNQVDLLKSEIGKQR